MLYFLNGSFKENEVVNIPFSIVVVNIPFPIVVLWTLISGKWDKVSDHVPAPNTYT